MSPLSTHYLLDLPAAVLLAVVVWFVGHLVFLELRVTPLGYFRFIQHSTTLTCRVGYRCWARTRSRVRARSPGHAEEVAYEQQNVSFP